MTKTGTEIRSVDGVVTHVRMNYKMHLYAITDNNQALLYIYKNKQSAPVRHIAVHLSDLLRMTKMRTVMMGQGNYLFGGTRKEWRRYVAELYRAGTFKKRWPLKVIYDLLNEHPEGDPAVERMTMYVSN